MKNQFTLKPGFHVLGVNKKTGEAKITSHSSRSTAEEVCGQINKLNSEITAFMLNVSDEDEQQTGDYTYLEVRSKNSGATVLRKDVSDKTPEQIESIKEGLKNRFPESKYVMIEEIDYEPRILINN